MNVSSKCRLALAGVALFLISFALTGCLSQDVVLVVEPDGSGQIAVTRVFPAQLVQMMEMQRVQMEQAGNDISMDMGFELDDLYYSEEHLRRSAQDFGSGVTYVNSRPVNRAGTRGAAVLYKFEDINDLRIPTNAMISLMRQMAGEDEMMSAMEAEFGAVETIQFVATETEEGLELRILMPSEIKKAAARRDRLIEKLAEETEDPTAGPADGIDPVAPPPGPEAGMGMAHMPGFTGTETPEEMVRMYFKGVRNRIAVEVRGELVDTNASHPRDGRPNRFDLFDLDFDRILDGPGADLLVDESHMEQEMSDPSQMMGGLYALPGSVLETESEVIIQFK